jgi:hypothetical protein
MKHFVAPKSRPLEYHKYHDVEIRASEKLPGQGYYYCLGCKKWVAWLSKADSAEARKMGLMK